LQKKVLAKQWSYLRKTNKMASNKEHLRLLLEFISKILEQEGNEWFHDELSLLISKKIISEKDNDIKLSAVTIKEIGSIDRYIENGLIPIIDYSLINDDVVKFTLIRDCIEMGKWRFSHFGQNQSFLDFCKYAFFQIEQLVNYYILEKNRNEIDEVIKFIKKYNPKADTEGKKTISAIKFSDKLFAVKEETGLSMDIKSILDKVSYARNISLHRSPEPKVDLKTLESEFKNSIKKKKEERNAKENEIIKEYYNLKFLMDRDYETVTSSINALKEIILRSLKKSNADTPHR
jgi:hypothetical protein